MPIRSPGLRAAAVRLRCRAVAGPCCRGRRGSAALWAPISPPSLSGAQAPPAV